MKLVNKKIFDSFKEARNFAEDLAKSNIPNVIKRSADEWVVFYSNNATAIINQNDLEIKLKDISSENSFLRSIDDKNNVIIDQLRGQLQQSQTLTDRKFDELNHKIKILEVYKNAYIQAFGNSEIIEVTKEIVEKAICRRCNGDGGINSGCVTCTGTGMVDEKIVFSEYKIACKKMD